MVSYTLKNGIEAASLHFGFRMNITNERRPDMSYYESKLLVKELRAIGFKFEYNDRRY